MWLWNYALTSQSKEIRHSPGAIVMFLMFFFKHDEENGAASSLEEEEDDSIETVIRGARSEGRILFEPAGRTSSVVAAEELDDRWDQSVHGDLDEEEEDDEADKGVALYVVVESRDPYRDFRASMEEMFAISR
ncbi:hypothetical protein SAY87_007604 [Trapa incisa]|uniref:Transcription repressor n=1 Tax=Trapa incisa TaxID=236973 RepID=A0AAN7QF60_9MYRT|nr:hypothetical protein SAY87_007604 [Trapa incisa]